MDVHPERAASPRQTLVAPRGHTGKPLEWVWLCMFPLLFLPNLGLSASTPFGVLEINDFLIIPFLLALAIAPSRRSAQQISAINTVLLVFLAWALLSALVIPLQFETEDRAVWIGSLLKLAKAALYVVAGIGIPSKLRDSRVEQRWLWSFLAALVVLSAGLFVTADSKAETVGESLYGYKGYNLVSSAIGITCSYFIGLWFDREGSRCWRAGAMVAVTAALGSAVWSSGLRSHGRGGMLALAIGVGYIIAHRANRWKAAGVILFSVAAFFVSYSNVPNFRNLVDLTVPAYVTHDWGSARFAEVDNGTRIRIWRDEAPKLLNSPLLGTGFFNRGQASGLEPTGSHNFFLQMFLETGLVGGFCVLLIFARMWHLASRVTVRRSGPSLATRAALLSAMVCGMSGEYYYGGIGVLLLFAAFALAGARPAIARGGAAGWATTTGVPA